jgi:hypothetical protein
VTDKETRVAIENWLQAKHSPMYGTADYGWVLARYSGISGSLSIAIAQAETQCATDENADQVAIKGHNAWGYGHSPGTHGYTFPSWPDGIACVTNELQKFVYGLYGAYPPCDTVLKLSGVWVNGDINKHAVGWAGNVSSVMKMFGGDPMKLQRSALQKEPTL